MKKTKKLIGMILGLTMVLGLTACGSTGKSAESSSVPATEAVSSEESTEKDSGTSDEAPAETSGGNVAEAETKEGGKTLVVYYSATGNTEEAANYIANATGADLFELEPAKPYTNDDLNWSNDDSRVSREHENPDEREVELVSAEVEDWDSYDTVFIGYPIWWGIAAWPLDGFVEANDFTGKTVIPFCTSSSSGLGESGELLAEMAGAGDWLDGERFSSSVSESDVQAWVEGLGL